MQGYQPEVNISEHWVPTKELRVSRRTGEVKPKLIKVRVANVTLTAPAGAWTCGKSHNLRISKVRRHGTNSTSWRSASC